MMSNAHAVPAQETMTNTLAQPFKQSESPLADRPRLHLIFMAAHDNGLLNKTEARRVTRLLESGLEGDAIKAMQLAHTPKFKDVMKEHTITMKALDALVAANENNEISFFSDVDNTLGAFPLGQHVGFKPQNHLAATLEALSRKVEHRFSFITGRPEEFLKTAFDDVCGYRASEFGAVIYNKDEKRRLYTVKRPIAPTYTTLDIALQNALTAHGDVLKNCFVEEYKTCSRTLALTSAPDQKAAIALLEPIADRFVKEHNKNYPDMPLDVHVNPANYNCTLEVKPTGLGDKKNCIAGLMKGKDLKGSTPVAMGDSGPDADMLKFAEEHGGISIAVGNQLAKVGYNAQFQLRDPKALQLALEAFVYAKTDVHPIVKEDRTKLLRRLNFA